MKSGCHHRRNISSNFRFYPYPTYFYKNCGVTKRVIGSKVCNVRALQLTLRLSIVPIGSARTIATVFSPRCRRSMSRCFTTILCDPACRLAMRFFFMNATRTHTRANASSFFAVTTPRRLYSSCLIMV